jgi:hypothetical protein
MRFITAPFARVTSQWRKSGKCLRKNRLARALWGRLKKAAAGFTRGVDKSSGQIYPKD